MSTQEIQAETWWMKEIAGRSGTPLGDRAVIVRMLFGSDLYGTSIEGSDKDYKGVFMPSRGEILLGRIPRTVNASTGPKDEKNAPGDVDTDMHSLHHFIKLACEGQTLALDMLWAPEKFWLESTGVWMRIVEERERFLTCRLDAFVGYARRQAAKYGLKGSRIDAATKVVELLRDVPEPDGVRLEALWDKLPEGEHLHMVTKEGRKQYQVCGRGLIPRETVAHALGGLEMFLEKYGARARMAAQNEGIDWKAVSHALRAAYQVKELLTNRTITFPRPEADFLKGVKLGGFDYQTAVAPVLEEIMAEVEVLAAESDLPELVDRRYWDEFVMGATAASL